MKKADGVLLARFASSGGYAAFSDLFNNIWGYTEHDDDTLDTAHTQHKNHARYIEGTFSADERHDGYTLHELLLQQLIETSPWVQVTGQTGWNSLF
jgi:hypothetical protein